MERGFRASFFLGLNFSKVECRMLPAGNCPWSKQLNGAHSGSVSSLKFFINIRQKQNTAWSTGQRFRYIQIRMHLSFGAGIGIKIGCKIRAYVSIQGMAK